MSFRNPLRRRPTAGSTVPSTARSSTTGTLDLTPAVPESRQHPAAVQVLVVCTANVSRSPLAAALINARCSTLDLDVFASSAGTRRTPTQSDQTAQALAAELGVSYEDHRPRHLTPEILAEDGRDLVLCMTREHAREVVASDPSAFARTFTLKEFVRLAGRQPSAPSLTALVDRVGAGRQPRDLLGASELDDVTDPFGRSSTTYRTVVTEIERLVDRFVAVLDSTLSCSPPPSRPTS